MAHRSSGPRTVSSAPGSHFREFYFDETGDTTRPVRRTATAGGWGSCSSSTRTARPPTREPLTLFFKGDEAHTGLDNITFLSRNQFAPSRTPATGCTPAHALDSGWVFDVDADYSKAGNAPLRWLAQGRDAVGDARRRATADSARTRTTTRSRASTSPTAIRASNGILGAEGAEAQSGNGKWRWFYTRQHGDNPTFQVIYDSSVNRHDDGNFDD